MLWRRRIIAQYQDDIQRTRATIRRATLLLFVAWMLATIVCGTGLKAADVMLGVPWPVRTGISVLCWMACTILFNVAGVWLTGNGIQARRWMAYAVNPNLFLDENLRLLRHSYL